MFKRIIPLLLAIIAAFSICAVTVFAANPNDATVTGNKVVKLGKTYKLENAGTTSPEETFYLIQKDKDVTDSSLTKAEVPDLVEITDDGYSGTGRLIGKIKFDEGAATVAGTTQKIEIELPAFTAVGIYTYTLHEVDGLTGGVTYWEHDIELVVTVMTNDDGTYYVAGVHAEEKVPDAEKAENFTNIYKATSTDPDTGGLSFTKTVSGNLGDRAKYFDFTVTFTGETGKDYSDATTITVSGGSHTSNPTTLNYTSYPQTVTFKLKHGETIRFGNVPYGVSYTYAESDYTGEGYDTTYPQIGTGTFDADSGEEIMAEDKSGTVNWAAKNYTVDNEKIGPIDTGIILDNLPYIMALAFVLIGGCVLFISRKRRNAGNCA